jgi:hypothetical protein
MLEKKKEPTLNNKADHDSAAAFLIVTCGVLLSCITVFFGYDILPDYQDKLVHLRRIAALADTLKAGYFPARIYFSMNGSTGYAMPAFYPDIFLYLPSFLYIIGIPLSYCYAVYVVIVNIITAVVSYFCLRKFLGEDKLTAAVMSLVYTVSVYRLTDVYIRDALGEYTAMAFLPLVVYGFYKIYASSGESKKDPKSGIFRDSIPLGVGMAALVSSHVLTTSMTAFFLAVLSVVFIRKTIKPYVLGRLIFSAFICILLSLYFIVPFIDYMLSDNYLVSGSSKVMRGFYPGWRELLELIPSGSGSGIAIELRMPTQIGAALTAIIAAWFVRAVIKILMMKKAGRSGNDVRRATVTGSVLFVMTGLFLFISSKYFPWTKIEAWDNTVSGIICSVQFSWRYIGLATVTAVFLGGVLVSDIRSHSKTGAHLMSVTIIILAIVPAVILESRACSENRHAFIDKGESIGIVSDELYFPVAWNRDASYDRVPVTDSGEVLGDYTVEKYRWTVNAGNAVDAVNAGTERILFPVVYYKGYTAHGTDGTELNVSASDDGRVMVDLPSGFDGSFVLEFRSPFYWRISEIISLLTLMTVLAGIAKWHKPADVEI